MNPYRSRKSSPNSRCKDIGGGDVGCSTVGWQDHVEIAPRVRKWWRLDPQGFERLFRPLFKQHARRMPSFLRNATFHVSEEPVQRRLFIATECSNGAPEWDAGRPRIKAGKLGTNCYVWTIVGYL